MNNLYKGSLKMPYYMIGIVFVALLFTTSTVSAHKSPADCTGSGLGITLFANAPQAHIGDVISYSLNIFNGMGGGAAVCDASDISASIVTPDGTSHPIALRRTALSNGDTDSYPNVVTYTAKIADVQTNGTLTASAVDTGAIHQNITDSQGGGNQSVNVTVVPIVLPSPTPSPTYSPTSSPTPSPTFSPTPSQTPSPTSTPAPVTPVVPVSVIPPPTGGGGGGGSSYPSRIMPSIGITKVATPSVLSGGPGLVTYTYTVVTAGSQLSLKNISLIDDKCSPVTKITGDQNVNGKLDPSESWTYSCTTKIYTTTTNIATVTGYGDDAYGQLVTATSSAIVTVSIPMLPNTGFPPEESGGWSITIGLLCMLVLVPTSLYAIWNH